MTITFGCEYCGDFLNTLEEAKACAADDRRRDLDERFRDDDEEDIDE